MTQTGHLLSTIISWSKIKKAAAGAAGKDFPQEVAFKPFIRTCRVIVNIM